MSAPFPLIFPFNTLKKKTFKICLARKLICAKLYQNHGARKLVRAKISTNKARLIKTQSVMTSNVWQILTRSLIQGNCK